MFTNTTLISGSAASALDGRRDIARGFKLARGWQQQGKWREAAQLYGSILTVEPRHFGPLCGLDGVYKQQGRREEAVALFGRAGASARWRRYANKLRPLLEALEPAAPHASPSGPMAPDHA